MTKKVIVLLTALAVTAGFTGCQREAMLTDSGQDTVDVNTHLVLNVATGAPQTKQVSEAVQRADNFRGMDKVHLLTYKLESDDKILTSSEATADAYYGLNRLFGGETTRRVLSIDLPVGTNTMVLYGKSPDVTGKVGNYSAEDYFGHLATYSPSKVIGDTYFQLGNRLTDSDNFSAMKIHIAGILTDVMGTALETSSHEGFSAEDVDVAVAAADYPEGITWATYGAIDDTQSFVPSIVETNAPWYVMEEKLAFLYKQMTGINYNSASTDTELRAGSGAAVLGMVGEMWKVIKSLTTTTATTKAEAVAKKLAKNIDTKLAGYFSYNMTTGENPVPDWTTLKFKESVGGYKPDEFPSNFNLMEGAAYITCTGGVFSYPNPYNVVGMGGGTPFDGSTGYTASDFYYPAELLYFGNSPVRTATVEYTANQYPSTDNWQGYEWANWPGHSIVKATQSVAMTNSIRYGVAMLETKVAYSAKVHDAEQLFDNTKAITGDDNIAIAVGDNTFKLTGIIIGGQPKHVGWNFLPVKDPVSGSPSFGKMASGFIYDKAVDMNVPYSDDAVTASNVNPNYTVVFDNYSTGNSQETVHIALEFQNNSGKDFYGYKNMIPKGGYFYLIGELNPANNDSGFTWPTDRIIPPYTVSGDNISTTEVKRVFIQSLMTSATFKIGENSLKYAYLSVPDLRSTSMTLGLSVDIEWKQGLKYGDVIVGGPESN